MYWLFCCRLHVLLGPGAGVPQADQDQEAGDSLASMPAPPPPSLTRCLHPDCREDCSDCEPAEIVTALKASIEVIEPGESWGVQFNGVTALAGLLDAAAKSAAANRAVVTRMGGIEALLEATDEALAVQPKTDLATPLGSEGELVPQLLARLVTVVGSLSVDSPRNQEFIAEHGGIAKITRAMSVGHHRYNHAELVTQGCWALVQLGTNSLENQKVIVGARGVEFAERAIRLRKGQTSHCQQLVEQCRYATKKRGGKTSLLHSKIKKEV